MAFGQMGGNGQLKLKASFRIQWATDFTVGVTQMLDERKAEKLTILRGVITLMILN